MDRNIKKIVSLILLVFVVAVMRLTQLQIFGGKFVSHPANTKNLRQEAVNPRGKIYSADGKILAESILKEGTYKRFYPQGKLTSHVVGFSHLKYGRKGAETYFNNYLSSLPGGNLVWEFTGRLTGKKTPSDITLTIDLGLQNAAKQALGERKGAVAVIDPVSGDILALYSNPSFDPNDLDSKWSSLTQADDSPLLQRASQGLYPPGSLMKIITAAGALKSGATENSLAEAPRELKVYGGKVTNYSDQSYGKMTLMEAFAKSSNTGFAKLGLEMGGKNFLKIAQNFGFNSKPGSDIAMNKSFIPAYNSMDDLELAWSAVGQGRVLASPLHFALIVSSIANKGYIPVPKLLKDVRIGGEIQLNQSQKRWLEPIDSDIAAQLENMMIETVSKGTGRAAKIDGITIAGKTGTAEVKNARPHAWFAGYAPAEDPKLAIAVVVENGGTGGGVAAPVAKNIFSEALQ